MKLNPDCIRYILFCVEENSGYGKTVDFSTILNTDEYQRDEIMYHINQCDLSDMFTKVDYWLGAYSGSIRDLTPKAHEFIANIRNDNNWNSIKSKAKEVGSFSLDILCKIAISYISSKL